MVEGKCFQIDYEQLTEDGNKKELTATYRGWAAGTAERGGFSCRSPPQ